MHRPIPCLVAMTFSMAACSDRPTLTDPAATSPNILSPRGFADPPSAAVAPGESLASVEWNAVTQAAIARNRPSQNAAWRGFAYVTLAQHVAIEAVAKHRGATRAAMRGAVAGAAAPVLAYLFPNDAGIFEAAVRADEASLATGRQKAFAKAEHVGREVGARVVARAHADRFDAIWTGHVPVGPGKWTSQANPPAPPLLPLLGQVQPFFMDSGSQFRPPEPSAFDSPTFREALAEVRAISDTRTAAQDSIAKFWAFPTGSLVVGHWNGLALELIDKYRFSEREAARALALMNTAGFDGYIACHDAKYTYWLVRPSAVDPAITLSIGLPNHPSYPSNHACVSGASAYVLGALFPTEAEHLAAMADEAALSRLYGGIHYRFDLEAGLEIARKVAALAIEVEHRHGLPALLQ